MLKINNKIIAKNYDVADNIFSKGFGLMFKNKVKRPLLFIFKKEAIIPLHMFFVFTTIDVIFINKRKEIVDIKEDFRPFTLYTPNKKSSFIVELPPGSIRKHKIKITQKAIFKTSFN